MSLVIVYSSEIADLKEIARCAEIQGELLLWSLWSQIPFGGPKICGLFLSKWPDQAHLFMNLSDIHRHKTKLELFITLGRRNNRGSHIS